MRPIVRSDRNARSRLEAVRGRRDGIDNTGSIKPQHGRQCGSVRIQALADQNFCKIQSGRVHAHAHFAIMRRRFIRLADR
ncbi:MAG TPA: hypothetical protein VEV17_01810 [Bryobacteraceae bacterium]|nr:hypothetical protein [Bryobacteraceae bacterium]